MAPSFHSRRINGPFDDPGVFISLTNQKRAILFDLGDNSPLSPRDVIKISHIFVSHTHMDHFIGFDRVLRLLLGREKTLHLYGPAGFLKNVEGKLASYTWNLVRQYPYPFVLVASEIRQDRVLRRRYACQSGFLPEEETTLEKADGILLEEPSISISCEILDHKTPCLAFSLCESFHVNINKDRLQKMGLAMGPWLNDFKKAIFEKKDPKAIVSAPLAENEEQKKEFRLGELADQIAIITPGQKISYVTDAAFSDENVEKILALCQGSDRLYIEACFSEQDREVALEKAHLTAAQAGALAAMAGAKDFEIFHFSPRYEGREELLEKEAREAWTATVDTANAATNSSFRLDPAPGFSG